VVCGLGFRYVALDTFDINMSSIIYHTKSMHLSYVTYHISYIIRHISSIMYHLSYIICIYKHVCTYTCVNHLEDRIGVALDDFRLETHLYYICLYDMATWKIGLALLLMTSVWKHIFTTYVFTTWQPGR
jgi:hypothetical protein